MRPVNSEHQILSGRRKRVKNIKHVRLFNLLGRGPALCGSTSHVSRAGKFYTICYEIISRTLDRVERVQRYRVTRFFSLGNIASAATKLISANRALHVQKSAELVGRIIFTLATKRNANCHVITIMHRVTPAKDKQKKRTWKFRVPLCLCVNLPAVVPSDCMMYLRNPIKK